MGHTLIIGNYSQTKIGLTLTVVLGFYFTILQILEYYEASFTFADSIYGSTFFIATGFHGLHVIIGTLFLLVMLMRQGRLPMILSVSLGRAGGRFRPWPPRGQGREQQQARLPSQLPLAWLDESPSSPPGP